MQVNFNSVSPFANHSFFYAAHSFLTPQQRKVALIAVAIFLGGLAIGYAIGRSCFFKECDDLPKRIGPLPKKYPTEKKDLAKLEREEEQKNEKISAAFNKRYAGLKTAPDVFRQGFAYALEKIFKLADQGTIKINKSVGTPTSKGGCVVYRFLALDWIKGGKLVDSCQGYELHLNDEKIKLVSSLPQHVLGCQDQDEKPLLKIIIHFGARCDLIPGEEVLKHTSAARGIDPIAAKFLWSRLNQKEQEHFLNWMLEPAMENDCPDYLAAVDYIDQLPHPKQSEIAVLLDLIDDIAVALEAKFQQNIASWEWANYLDSLDLELQPFVKQEKEISAAFKTEEIVEEEDEPFTTWQLNADILSDFSEEGVATQPEFYELVKNTQQAYQIYFKSFQKGMTQNPVTSGKIIDSVTWTHLEGQYHRTHQLIEDHGCLLSNLLAVVMVDESDLKGENVKKLKKAMAAYLKVPKNAEIFEVALKNDFSCNLSDFIEWLRGENDLLDGVYLTTTVLEIAAFTLGVRIVLFSPQSYSNKFRFTKGKADEWGKIIPSEDIPGHHFGPKTQEILTLAIDDTVTIHNAVTYYGLFPKINSDITPNELGISDADWSVMQSLDYYWQSIYNERI